MSFFQSLLRHDSHGDGAFRVGKAQFSHKQNSAVGECDCQVPREAFDIVYGPMVLISNWSISETQLKQSNEAVALVRFHVLATTGGEGDVENGIHQRRIVASIPPHDETIIFRIRRKNNMWYVIDPPLPRVEIDSAIRLIDEALSRYPSLDHRTAPVQAGYQWLRSQLDTIRQIRQSVVPAADKGPTPNRI